MTKPKAAYVGEIDPLTPEIYLNIDHLKCGTYRFHFVQKDKVIKTIQILKS